MFIALYVLFFKGSEISQSSRNVPFLIEPCSQAAMHTDCLIILSFHTDVANYESFDATYVGASYYERACVRTRCCRVTLRYVKFRKYVRPYVYMYVATCS